MLTNQLLISYVGYCNLISVCYLFQVHCVCHFFNLDGLTHIKNKIQRIRDTLIYIKISRSRKTDTKIFVSDVRHRRNSAYLLLKSCEGYEHLMTKFYNSIHIRNDDDIILNEYDWMFNF